MRLTIEIASLQRADEVAVEGLKFDILYSVEEFLTLVNPYPELLASLIQYTKR